MKYILRMYDNDVEDAYVGPFNTREDAEQAGGRIFYEHDWEILELVAYDRDNLPLLASDFARMKWKSHD